MRHLIRLALCLGLLPAVAMAQDLRMLSGSVAYRDRIALPPGATLLVEVRGPDQSLVTELRLPTDGRQVPIPFALPAVDAAGATLRAGIMAGAELAWLGDPVPVPPDAQDLGQIPLSRPGPMVFPTTYLCGDRVIRTGLAGDRLIVDMGHTRMALSPVPAASGARYAADGDPATLLWSRGDGAQVTLSGVALPECRIALPPPERPVTAQGNEPFWTATLGAGELLLRRLGREELGLPITATTLAEDGAITVTADDPARALRAVMIRQPVLCHDTMTGMPYPDTVSLSIGDETLTGCGGDPAALLTGRTWQIDGIDGTAPPKDATATLTFHPDGRATGTGGCNRWFAGYSLTGEGLTFQQAGATMMACAPDVMEAERRFLEALGRVTGFDIDPDGALILHAGDAAPILAARAVSAAP